MNQQTFTKAIINGYSVKVPPINLLNVSTIYYLFSLYPYLVKSKKEINDENRT